MTVVTVPGRTAAPGPALTTGPTADRVIAVLFAVSVAVFLLALVTL
ncbi:hypothetical protein [Pseudonocardia sp.]|nr:hypothetical protein [Pseudonocardia sp.]